MPTLIPIPLLNVSHLQDIARFLINPHAPEEVQLNSFVVELISYCSGNPRYLELVLVVLSAKLESLEERVKIRAIDLAVLRSQNASSLQSSKSDVMSRVRLFLVKHVHFVPLLIILLRSSMFCEVKRG